MLTTCPAAAAAGSRVHAASVAAAAGTAPPDPARVVTPTGTPHCKSAGTPAPAEPRTTRSNRADRTAALENLRADPLGAGPRAPPSPLPRLPLPRLPLPLPPPPARVAAADNADLAHAAAADP